MNKKVEILSERFLLRPLTEGDVTERYLSWLCDSDAERFITAAADTKAISDLKEYVSDRIGRVDIFFLGIFEKATGLHIGNIKFEPVNSELGYALMGMLIGEPECRGKGVAAEVLLASAQWLKRNRNITQILLGVSKNNTAAIRAYEKVGFKFSKSEFLPDHPSLMVWDLLNQADCPTST